jgi:prepilin signal peptidase PulO-like enzyme (type II secretory pathway)
MIKAPDINGLTISLFLVLIVFLVALIIKNRKGREAIGPADYLAIFSFSFSLSSSSVGIWIIMFSSLGMIHSLVNKRQSIPLIPFLFSAWCLAYAYY